MKTIAIENPGKDYRLVVRDEAVGIAQRTVRFRSRRPQHAPRQKRLEIPHPELGPLHLAQKASHTRRRELRFQRRLDGRHPCLVHNR